MGSLFIQDFNELPSSFEVNDSTGFVSLKGNIARVGIQEYKGYELGRKGDNNTYKVLRPLEVVKDSVSSFIDNPITVEHHGLITIKNSKEHQRGYIKDAWFDDETGWVKNQEIINTPEGIKAIVQDGYRWHSCGYTASIEWEKGEYEGETYNAKFTSIKGNHLALVKNPRAGDNATFDSTENNDSIIINKNDSITGIAMSKKYQVTLLDSALIELEGDHASDVHQLIVSLQDEKAKLENLVSDSNDKIKTLEAKVSELTNSKIELEGEVSALKVIADSKPENLTAEKIAEIISVYDSVRHLIKSEKPFEKSATELKAEAIQAVGQGDLITDGNEIAINKVFETLKKYGEFNIKDAKSTVDPVSVLKDTKQTDSNSEAEKAAKEYLESIEKAWMA